jgi:hypothetical protein
MTLRELRDRLAEAFDDAGSVQLSYDDIAACLEPSVKDVATRSGIAAFVPFKYAKKTPESVKRVGMTSKQALGTLKRDIPLPNDKVAKKVDQKTFYSIVDKMARAIATRTRRTHPDIDVIVHAASSSDMTMWLAEVVGQTLDVPVVNDAVLKRKGDAFSIDEDRFKEWSQGRTAEDVKIVRALLEKTVESYRRTGKIAASKGLPFEWRQFFNTHVSGPGVGNLRGKKVLVIDDNIDMGWTFAGIEKLLVAAGVSSDDIVFAAGYDYSQRS